MAISDKDKLFADLWVRQSDILQKGVALLPLAEAAILAGWYTLGKDHQELLANGVAVLGMLAMAAASLYMARTVHYVGIFRKKITGILGVASPSFLNGRNACLSVPFIFTAANFALLFLTSWIVPPPASPLLHLLSH